MGLTNPGFFYISCFCSGHFQPEQKIDGNIMGLTDPVFFIIAEIIQQNIVLREASKNCGGETTQAQRF